MTLAEDSESEDELERLELELLFEAVFRHYGFDFRSYAPASLRRRVRAFVRTESLSTVSGLQERILHDAACMERLLLQLSINVTAMFRDPGFYASFRTNVVPHLRTHPFVRIWHAGCSTGEEVYSMAILLTEENLYDRCRIYATDMNEPVILKARAGIFPLSQMQDYTTNYLKAGGKASFSEYYTAHYDGALFRKALAQNVMFSQHNLVTDGSFNEFNVIICRNVMIYFNASLQARVHDLLYKSLRRDGFLVLGTKESLKDPELVARYETVDAAAQIYRKRG
jgi:chemotaxis protein methyltransferase CheR